MGNDQRVIENDHLDKGRVHKKYPGKVWSRNDKLWQYFCLSGKKKGGDVCQKTFTFRCSHTQKLCVHPFLILLPVRCRMLPGTAGAWRGRWQQTRCAHTHPQPPHPKWGQDFQRELEDKSMNLIIRKLEGARVGEDTKVIRVVKIWGWIAGGGWAERAISDRRVLQQAWTSD